MVEVNVKEDFEPKLAHFLNQLELRITKAEEQILWIKEEQIKNYKGSEKKMVQTDKYKPLGVFLKTSLVAKENIKVRVNERPAEFRDSEFKGRINKQLLIYADTGKGTEVYTLAINKQNNHQIAESLKSYDTDKWVNKWLLLTKVKTIVGGKPYVVWDMTGAEEPTVEEETVFIDETAVPEEEPVQPKLTGF